ncbi:MAG: DUF6263 family protein [Mangrovibacterium sp.]
MKKLLFFLPFMCLFYVSEAKKADLLLNLEVGKSYQVQSLSNGTITQEMMGKAMTFDLLVSTSTQFTVTGKSADVYELELQYTDLSMEMKNSQMNMTFSSDSTDTSNPISIMLSKMKGQIAFMKINSKGKVLEMTGFAKIISSMVETLSNGQEPQRAQMIKQLQDAYGDEAMKNNLSSTFSILPQKPVAVGDTWEFSQTINQGTSLTIHSTCTLKSEEEEVYTIVTVGKVLTPADAPAFENAGMQMKMEMSGKSSSEIKLDKTTGWIVEGTGILDLTGIVTILPSAQIPNNMEIPMTIKTTTSYTGEK